MGEGLTLMVLGMTTVFGFLALLVLLMTVSTRLFSAYGHLFADDPAPALASSGAPAAVAGGALVSDEAEIAVAIAAAEAWARGGGTSDT